LCTDVWVHTRAGTIQWITLRYTLHWWSVCFHTSICCIYCIDQPKTFTLLLKSEILDFETISRVHVYRIKYVFYRLLTVLSQPFSSSYVCELAFLCMCKCVLACFIHEWTCVCVLVWSVHSCMTVFVHDKRMHMCV